MEKIEMEKIREKLVKAFEEMTVQEYEDLYNNYVSGLDDLTISFEPFLPYATGFSKYIELPLLYKSDSNSALNTFLRFKNNITCSYNLTFEQSELSNLAA